MLVAEADGVIFIGNPASCGCPATRFRDCLDCKSCYTIKTAIYRTGAMCNRGCGVDLGIGQHLLGTMKEWMILRTFTCSGCAGTRCAVEDGKRRHLVAARIKQTKYISIDAFGPHGFPRLELGDVVRG